MLKLYNTLPRKKQVFKPLKLRRKVGAPTKTSADKKVGLYTCGPTVYDYAHIGNLRTYIFEDILRRTLKYSCYKVKQVMNITDVEDKIIKRAQKENKNIGKITIPFSKIFFADIKKLNIEKSEFYPRATTHIKEMIGLIKKLIVKGFAYQGKDKSIYFDISKFKNYGKLSGLKKREIKIGARIEADEYNKSEAQDFVLWKSKKAGEPSWPSPWGEGRPGWHIECSAMSMKYLGATLDIHAGGVDLIFPHHENEIAQSEAATGRNFSRYWLHAEHLLVDGQKMSKSLGNIFTLKDLENKKFSPLAFRYLVLTSHYRSKLNFTWKSLEAAQNALNKLYEALANLKISRSKNNPKSKKLALAYREKFLEAINNDLDTPTALALIWQIIKDFRLEPTNKRELLLKFDSVLGLNLAKIKKLTIKIPQKIKDLAVQREKLRSNKQFIQADRLRKKIETLGYIVGDTPYGPKITATRY